MEQLKIRVFEDRDERALIALWRQCELVVPWNNPRSDIARKRSDSPELLFVGEIDEHIVATCMAGYDGHRGWIYYLAVHPDWQRQGLAAALMRHAEKALIAMGCPKINLMVRATNPGVIEFYHRIGYGDDPVVVLSRRLIEDEPDPGDPAT